MNVYEIDDRYKRFLSSKASAYFLLFQKSVCINIFRCRSTISFLFFPNLILGRPSSLSLQLMQLLQLLSLFFVDLLLFLFVTFFDFFHLKLLSVSIGLKRAFFILRLL